LESEYLVITPCNQAISPSIFAVAGRNQPIRADHVYALQRPGIGGPGRAPEWMKLTFSSATRKV